MKSFMIIPLVLWGTISVAQVYTDPKEMFDEGKYFFQREDYKEALYFFSRLTDEYPENANFNFLTGECYLNIPGQEHLAVPFLEMAAKYTIPKKEYNSRSFDEKNAPLHAYFYLGNAYRYAGKLDEALEVYNTFLDSPYFYGNYNLSVVEQEIKSCERAKIIEDSPIDIQYTPFAGSINTEFSEFNAILSADGNTLVFMRGLQFYNAVFVSQKVEDVWQQPVNINQQIISDGDFYPTGISKDGTKILFVREENQNADIYISEYKNAVWSKAEKLNGKVNTLYSESFASFANNDKSILVVSNKKGNQDIYMSNQGVDNSWSKLKSVGKSINTDLDEDTPVLCNNEKTIFFSSKGHFGMGGFDIFYSNLEGKKWSTPRNVGYPVSTTGDDLFFMTESGCKSAVYSIIDKDTGLSDIYIVNIIEPLAIP